MVLKMELWNGSVDLFISVIILTENDFMTLKDDLVRLDSNKGKVQSLSQSQNIQEKK